MLALKNVVSMQRRWIISMRVRYIPYLRNLLEWHKRSDVTFVLLPEAGYSNFDIWKTFLTLCFSCERWFMLIPPKWIIPHALQYSRHIIRTVPREDGHVMFGMFVPGVCIYPFSLTYFGLEAQQGADFLFSDQLQIRRREKPRTATLLRPGFDQVFLHSYDYLGDFVLFSSSLVCADEFRSWVEGHIQRYDLMLRLAERTQKPKHLSQILYSAPWRKEENTVEALTSHLKKYFPGCTVQRIGERMHHVQYPVPKDALVSIIIPTRDHLDDLRKCVESVVRSHTTVPYEILIIENGSTEPDLFTYYDELVEKHCARIIEWNNSYNFAGISNFAAHEALGDYLLFLNNDTETISNAWLEEMLMFACQPNIGAVGAQLRYPDNTIQHAGILLGVGGIAGHAYKHLSPNDNRNMHQLHLAHLCTAVTGACLMVNKQRYFSINGMDESLPVAYNDVDLCMRLAEIGYSSVYTPYAVLYHDESKTRGNETGEKQARFEREANYFYKRWESVIRQGDPYMHPLYSKNTESFTL